MYKSWVKYEERSFKILSFIIDIYWFDNISDLQNTQDVKYESPAVDSTFNDVHGLSHIAPARHHHLAFLILVLFSFYFLLYGLKLIIAFTQSSGIKHYDHNILIYGKWPYQQLSPVSDLCDTGWQRFDVAKVL